MNSKSIETLERELERAIQDGDMLDQGTAYNDLGSAYFGKGRFAKAAEMFQKSLDIAVETKDLAGEARACSNLGITLRSLGQFDNSVALHLRHLKIAEQKADVADQGVAYGNLGNTYDSLGRFEQSIEMHEKRLQIAIQCDDLEGQGSAYGNLGNAYFGLGKFAKAIEFHEKDLEIAKQTGNLASQGASLSNMGIAYGSQGKISQAIEMIEEYLKIVIQTDDIAGQGAAYGNLGIGYSKLGQFTKAIEMHEGCLRIMEQTGDIAGQGRAYGNLGNAYRSLGQFTKAIEYHQKRLEIAMKIGDVPGQGAAFGNMGAAYEAIGQYGTAISMHEQRLAVAKRIGDLAGQARAYGNLGNAHRSLGQYSHAIEMHKRSLDLEMLTGDVGGVGTTYGNLGNAYFSQGHFVKAIKMHEKNLEIAKQTGDLESEGASYGNLGNAFHSLGQFEKAIDFHQKRLDIAKQIGDIAGEGRACGNLGKAYRSLEQFMKAIELIERDVQISQSTNNITGSFLSSYNLGVTYMKMNQSSEAIPHFQAALHACESLQDHLLDRDYDRITIFEQQRMCYVQLQQAFLQLGKDGDALATSERSKARALHHLMHKSDGDADCQKAVTFVDVSQMVIDEGTVLVEYAVLDEDILAVWVVSPSGKLLCSRSVSQHGLVGDCGVRLAALLELTRHALGARSRLELLRDRETSEIEIKDGPEESLASRNAAEKLKEQQKEIAARVQQILKIKAQGDADVTGGSEVVVDPHVEEQALAILKQHEEVCFWIRSLAPDCPAHEHELLSFVEALEAGSFGVLDLHALSKLTDEVLAGDYKLGGTELRGLLLSRISDLCDEDKLLRKLYAVLIKPVEKEICSQKDLLIVPDLDLFMVPWAALKSESGSFLIESHSIRLAPSLSVSKRAARAAQQPGRPPKVAIVGNPWPVAASGFMQLPHAVDEAHLVASLFGVSPLTGPKATKPGVLELLAGADLAHLACHGWLERQALVMAHSAQEDDALLSSDDGLLTSEEIRTGPALAVGSTVLLSACNSARGRVYGEGVVGLSRAFLAAGAGCVVVSLWSIPDKSTKMLMQAMYSALAQGYHVPQALRFAMLAMLRHGGRRARPMSWAGFIVTGASTTICSALRQTGAGTVGAFGVDEVGALLEQCGLDQAAATARACGVDGKTLLMLSEADLTAELGLSASQARLLLTEVAARLQAGRSGSATCDHDGSQRPPVDFDMSGMAAALHDVDSAWGLPD